MRFLLFPFSLIYDGLTRLRNYLFDSGFFSSVSFDLPVISVGNLSAGGTGKTPHIEYLVRLLLPHCTVATLSRGYKRKTQGFVLADQSANARTIGDEPMQYHTKFPNLVVAVSEERVTGIPDILTLRPDVNLILLDDAFQHRTVRPGLSVLLTEYDQPFFKDHVLPMGRLRECRKGYRRADVIIVTKCPPNLDSSNAEELKQQIQPLPHQQVFFSSVRYGTPYELWNGKSCTLEGRSIVLVSAIAKPQALKTFVAGFAERVTSLNYPDHHDFSKADVERMLAAYRDLGADAVILTTEKDAQRLRLHEDELKQTPIVVLPIEVFILLDEQSRFDRLILEYVRRSQSDLGDPSAT